MNQGNSAEKEVVDYSVRLKAELKSPRASKTKISLNWHMNMAHRWQCRMRHHASSKILENQQLFWPPQRSDPLKREGNVPPVPVGSPAWARHWCQDCVHRQHGLRRRHRFGLCRGISGTSVRGRANWGQPVEGAHAGRAPFIRRAIPSHPALPMPPVIRQRRLVPRDRSRLPHSRRLRPSRHLGG